MLSLWGLTNFCPLFTVIEQIFQRAKYFADNSSRESPSAADLLEACEEYDLDIKELRKDSKKWMRKRKRGMLIIYFSDIVLTYLSWIKRT